jgi:nucleotide-binding universal stress UspA family protein
MSGEFRDVAIIIDGTDISADTVHAGVGLALARSYGSRLTVFERGSDPTLERFAWYADADDDMPYGGVEFCGVHVPQSHRRTPRLSMDALIHDTLQTGRWIQNYQSNDLLKLARCTDLIIAGSPVSTDAGADLDTDDFIVRVGRPVLVIPRKFSRRRPSDRQIGHRILVAWNASAESTRAIHDALPLLRQAEEITLTFVDERQDTKAARQIVMWMSEHLAQHGVKTHPEVIPVGDAWASRIILDRLQELGSNLLVMGAFSRSRFRETWFGGASNELLHSVPIPILTSH